MTRIFKCPRISDPSQIVEVEHEDQGLKEIRIGAEGGGVEIIVGYVSLFKFNDELHYHYLSEGDMLFATLDGGTTAQARYNHDVALFAAIDTNLPAGIYSSEY